MVDGRSRGFLPLGAFLGLLMVTGCDRFQSLAPGEKMTPVLSATDPEFLPRDLPNLLWDLKDDRLAIVNPRAGHVAVWNEGKVRVAHDDRLPSVKGVSVEKNEVLLLHVLDEPIQVSLLVAREAGSKGLTLDRTHVKTFSHPVLQEEEDGSNKAAVDNTFRVDQVRFGEKKKVLVLVKDREEYGLLVFNRIPGKTNLTYILLSESNRAPSATFKFQKYLLGQREEMIYAVHVSSSRRGIERTQITRIEPLSGRVLGKVVYRSHPNQLFDIFDDAEAVFSSYDEGDQQWVFEHRHLDTDRLRTQRVLKAQDRSPLRVVSFGHAYGGILMEQGKYVFCLYR